MPLAKGELEAEKPDSVGRRMVFGVIGLVLGGVFLYFALRNISYRDFESVLQRFSWPWLVAGVIIYLTSIALRCLRWGILLRAAGMVKWRHAVEALLAGYAANYLLPARIGELFRADYAMRLFHMNRFTSLGTIFVERVIDGIILVCPLWICLAILSFSGANTVVYPTWPIAAAVTASIVFGVALLFGFLSGRVDLGRLGLPHFIRERWEKLANGMLSVARSHTGTVVACSFGIWMLEVLALSCIARAFGAELSVPQLIVLMVLGSLSTLIPTAPGFIGTFQFVFAQVLPWFGYSASIGVVVATSLQLFCFGGVTVLGIFAILSRSGLVIFRGMRLR